jgi:hypothetical protein
VITGLVSTIIPVYNRPVLLRECVQSVLQQSHTDFEVIIVDDGSDDPAMAASLSACETLGAGKVRVMRQPNSGPGAARQRGLEAANGEFIQFLDSDDLLLPRKFGIQVAALQAQAKVHACYGKTRYVDANGTVTAPWRRTGERIDLLFPSMLASRWWGTSTPLYRMSALLEAGPISNLRNEEDWEFDCRLGAAGARLVWVDEWVSEQRALAHNRACAGGSIDPEKLQDRAHARRLILEHALRAGVDPRCPEFEAFIRSSFLLARQCALAGLPEPAADLVDRLQRARPRRVMGAYLAAGRVFGFGRTTRLAEAAWRAVRRLRPGVSH